MTERRLRAAIAVLALAGAALAAYLVYARYSGTRLACTTGGCETVQSSSYAKVLGVPVAVLGLAAYLAIFASALVGHDLARAAGAAVALAGAAFAGYLFYAQLALIDAVCEWCLASDAVIAALAALTLMRLLASRIAFA